MRETINTLSSEKSFSIDKVIGARRKRMLRRRRITARQKRVVSAALAGNRGGDVIVDINKGETRGSHGVNVAPTIVANSLPYRVKEKRVLEPMESMALQGIFPEDFPAMRSLSDSMPVTVMRDLAGNAFSSTVCMAVLVAGFVHAPL